MFLFSFLVAFKGGSGFSIEVDDSFAVATKSSDVDSVAERLNIEPTEVKSYFKQNALKFIAVSEDTLTQIRVSRFADNFSGDVYDSKNLDEDLIKKMVSLYGADDSVASIVESNGRKFAKITDVLKDSGGVYTSTQYVTVAGGKTFIISCYNSGNSTSSEVQKIFQTFSVKDIDERIGSYSVGKKLVLPAIIIMCAIVVISVIGVCRHFYEND